MSATLIFDFQKRKQLRFSEVEKDPILHVTTTVSLWETRKSSGPIPHPLNEMG